MELSLVLNGAIETIQSCMRERVSRYNSLAAEWSLAPMNESILEKEGAPVDVSVDWRTDLAYDEWIKGVSEEEREGLHRWLLHLKVALKMIFLWIFLPKYERIDETNYEYIFHTWKIVF